MSQDMFTIELWRTRFNTWQCRVSYSTWNGDRFEPHQFYTKEGESTAAAFAAAEEAVAAIVFGQEPETAPVRQPE